eukprot:5844564-Lingulodinium_polyedra.AAC.1
MVNADNREPFIHSGSTRSREQSVERARDDSHLRRGRTGWHGEELIVARCIVGAPPAKPLER